MIEVTLINSGADNMNCIQEILIPLKYYEKSSERARTRLLRTTMVTLIIMVMRTIVLAHPMMTRCLLDVLTPLSLVTKRGSSFGYESSHTHRGVSIGDFC